MTWHDDAANSHATQGLAIGTFRPSKCRKFRVASVARRATAMPAICVFRMSIGRPAFCRSAAIDAASVAAALSKSNTRLSRSSFSNRPNAASSVCRRRPPGSSAKPRRVSKSLMLVIQIDSAGWLSSQPPREPQAPCASTPRVRWYRE